MLKNVFLKIFFIFYLILSAFWLVFITNVIFNRQLGGQQYSLIKELAIYPLFISIVIIIWKSKDLVKGKLFEKWSVLKSGDLNPFRGKLWFTILAVSAISLFAELMIIRLHSIYFPVFAFYKNISLFSCFLGLGIGFARVKKTTIPVFLIFPLFALQIIFLDSVSSSPLESFLLNPIPEHFTMGLSGVNNLDNVFFVYIFLVLIFLFNAICFIPLGQIISKSMENKKKLTSYSWNLLGSLFGILIFSFLSFLSTTPSVWIIFFAISLIIFLRRNYLGFLTSFLFLCLTLLFIAQHSLNEISIYSPYQNLKLRFENDMVSVEANKTYFQRMVDLRKENIKDNDFLKIWADYYNTPLLIKPDAKNVLIVGSGTGNDVAAALRSSAVKIDAVEIDPTVVKIGKLLHPELPYLSSKVNIVVTDARSFIRNTNKNYDLIVYGLLDSHTLLSGKSSVRLDSFVYTVEAFREARERLNPEGIIVLTFAGRSEMVGKKLQLMLTEAFDGKKPRAFETKGLTFVAGDNLPDNLNLPSDFNELSDHFERSTYDVDKATDNWPFFYMSSKKIPFSAAVLILILFSVSLVLLSQLSRGYVKNLSATSFFLGSGFMLIEAKGITELALFYGTTWFVNSIVISAILILAFCANLVVMKVRNLNKTLIYLLLLASIFAGYFASSYNSSFSANLLGKIAMSFLITLPIFFSGLAFSSEMKTTKMVSIALFSNLIGAMLGGFLEYSSMHFGYKFLYLLAVVIYVFAFISSKLSKTSG